MDVLERDVLVELEARLARELEPADHREHERPATRLDVGQKGVAAVDGVQPNAGLAYDDDDDIARIESISIRSTLAGTHVGAPPPRARALHTHHKWARGRNGMGAWAQRIPFSCMYCSIRRTTSLASISTEPTPVDTLVVAITNWPQMI